MMQVWARSQEKTTERVIGPKVSLNIKGIKGKEKKKELHTIFLVYVQKKVIAYELYSGLPSWLRW